MIEKNTDAFDAADVREAVEYLREAMEPLCGFKPENCSQAISLLATRLLETAPALEALSNLACRLDAEGR